MPKTNLEKSSNVSPVLLSAFSVRLKKQFGISLRRKFLLIHGAHPLSCFVTHRRCNIFVISVFISAALYHIGLSPYSVRGRAKHGAYRSRFLNTLTAAKNISSSRHTNKDGRQTVKKAPRTFEDTKTLTAAAIYTAAHSWPAAAHSSAAARRTVGDSAAISLPYMSAGATQANAEARRGAAGHRQASSRILQPPRISDMRRQSRILPYLHPLSIRRRSLNG